MNSCLDVQSTSLLSPKLSVVNAVWIKPLVIQARQDEYYYVCALVKATFAQATKQKQRVAHGNVNLHVTIEQSGSREKCNESTRIHHVNFELSQCNTSPNIALHRFATMMSTPKVDHLTISINRSIKTSTKSTTIPYFHHANHSLWSQRRFWTCHRPSSLGERPHHCSGSPPPRDFGGRVQGQHQCRHCPN